MGSGLLVLACTWDIPIYVNVQSYFGRYVDIVILKQNSRAFAKMMELNNDNIGSEEGKYKPVKDWIVEFSDFEGATIEDRVDSFMKNRQSVEKYTR